VNIDHPACQWSVHPDIRRWDDHILFRPNKSQSDPGRKSGNKTTTTAIYPLDDELKQSLLWYLAVRPEPRSPEEPLFFNTEYERLSAKSMGKAFRRRSKEITERNEGPKCWYGSRDDDNINPHYWRHWATTWYQDQTGDEALVQYLRGDTGQASKANYNQYSDRKEQQILEHMPTFFEPFIEE
jgi:integrase